MTRALVFTILFAALVGCTPKAIPMAEWHCDGWRTVAPGVNECMDVRRRP